MTTEGISPDTGNGSDQSPDKGVERRMAELLDQFEGVEKKGKMPSDFEYISNLIDHKRRDGESILEIAQDKDTVLGQTIAAKYPTLEDRELLAGAVHKKYVAADSPYYLKYIEKYEKDEDTDYHRKDPDVFVMSRVIDRARDIVNFFMALDDLEAERMENQPTKESREAMADLRRKIQEAKEQRRIEVAEKFNHLEIDIPRTDGFKEPFRKWAGEITEHIYKEDAAYDEAEHYAKSTDEFRTLFNHHFTDKDQDILVDELELEARQIHRDYLEAQSAIIDHEPSIQEEERERILRNKLNKLNLLLRFVGYIMRTSELRRP
jgi:hypothetical protein